MDGTWGLQAGTFHSSSYSLTESPSGDYDANLEISTTLRALDFSGATSAEISFWTKYSIEADYDYMYLEVSENGSDWDQLASFTGSQNTWTEKTYSLTDYVEKQNIIIRFRFTSDVYVEEDGMYIDDLQVMIGGVSVDDLLSGKFISIYPNPADNHVIITAANQAKGAITLSLTDVAGKLIHSAVTEHGNAGNHTFMLDTSGLPEGLYLIYVTAPGHTSCRKLIITR
jgi:hypothetical protein